MKLHLNLPSGWRSTRQNFRQFNQHDDKQYFDFKGIPLYGSGKQTGNSCRSQHAAQKLRRIFAGQSR